MGEATVLPTVSLLLIKNNFKERLVLILKQVWSCWPAYSLGRPQSIHGHVGPPESALLEVSVRILGWTFDRFFVVLELGVQDSPGVICWVILSEFLFPPEVFKVF